MAVDPMSMALMFADTKGGASLLGGLGSGLGSSLGSNSGPSHAESGVYGSGLDGSGWSINFAGVQNAGSNQDKSGGVPGLGISGVSAVPWYVWALLGGAALWKLRKSK